MEVIVVTNLRQKLMISRERLKKNNGKLHNGGWVGSASTQFLHYFFPFWWKKLKALDIAWKAFFKNPIFSCNEQLKKWRCPSVCSFVFPSVPFLFLLVSLKFLLVLKIVNGVSRQFKECLKFNGSFKEFLRLFQGCFKEVSRVFQGILREISRVLKKVFGVFQLRLRGVSSSFKGVSRIFEIS